MKPYFACSGLPMMALPFLSGPGLYLQQASSGMPAASCRAPIWSYVVEVDDRAGLARGDELRRRRVVGGEHDVLAADARLLREDDLGKRARVGAEALLGEDLEDEGIGQGLDREEFLEAVAEDREGVDELPRVVPDGPLVVEMEGRGVLGADRLEALPGKR